jgi:hypothetical protein
MDKRLCLSFDQNCLHTLCSEETLYDIHLYIQNCLHELCYMMICLQAKSVQKRHCALDLDQCLEQGPDSALKTQQCSALTLAVDPHDTRLFLWKEDLETSDHLLELRTTICLDRRYATLIRGSASVPRRRSRWGRGLEGTLADLRWHIILGMRLVEVGGANARCCGNGVGVPYRLRLPCFI